MKKPTSRSRAAAATKKTSTAKKPVYDEDDMDEDEDDQPASTTAPKKVVPRLLLANKYDLEKGPDPTGWWCSEKLDGYASWHRLCIAY